MSSISNRDAQKAIFQKAVNKVQNAQLRREAVAKYLPKIAKETLEEISTHNKQSTDKIETDAVMFAFDRDDLINCRGVRARVDDALTQEIPESHIKPDERVFYHQESEIVYKNIEALILSSLKQHILPIAIPFVSNGKSEPDAVGQPAEMARVNEYAKKHAEYWSTDTQQLRSTYSDLFTHDFGANKFFKEAHRNTKSGEGFRKEENGYFDAMVKFLANAKLITPDVTALTYMLFDDKLSAGARHIMDANRTSGETILSGTTAFDADPAVRPDLFKGTDFPQESIDTKKIPPVHFASPAQLDSLAPMTEKPKPLGTKEDAEAADAKISTLKEKYTSQIESKYSKNEASQYAGLISSKLKINGRYIFFNLRPHVTAPDGHCFKGILEKFNDIPKLWQSTFGTVHSELQSARPFFPTPETVMDEKTVQDNLSSDGQYAYIPSTDGDKDKTSKFIQFAFGVTPILQPLKRELTHTD